MPAELAERIQPLLLPSEWARLQEHGRAVVPVTIPRPMLWVFSAPDQDSGKKTRVGVYEPFVVPADAAPGVRALKNPWHGRSVCIVNQIVYGWKGYLNFLLWLRLSPKEFFETGVLYADNLYDLSQYPWGKDLPCLTSNK